MSETEICQVFITFENLVWVIMSAAPSLEDVKFIDQRTKDVIFGYIKDVQQLFPKDNSYYIIPKLVIYWCLLYYYQNEQFDPTQCSAKIKLSDNNTIATQSSRGPMMVLLTSKHKTGIHEWKFKLLHKTDYTAIIGVYKTKYDADLDQHLAHAGKGKGYGLDVDTYLTDGTTGYTSDKIYGEKCVTGDVITMILDLEALQLKYCINGKDYGTAFKDIECTEYRACVSGYSVGNRHPKENAYRLLSYKQLK